MDEYLSEKEQLEQIRQWWKENGWYIVGGVALGVVLLLGWNRYQAYRVDRSEGAAELYLQLRDEAASESVAEAAGILEQLRGDYRGTAYVDQAGLLMAKLYMEVNDPLQAAEELRFVMENSADPQLAMIARLRLSRVLAYEERYDAALELLDGVDPGNFRSRYSEVMGDIHVAQGDFERARAAYQQALRETEPGLLDTNLVQMKLDDLPPAADVETDTETDGESDQADAETTP